MSHRDLFILWPGSPLLSVLLWIGVAVAFLYLARSPAHRAIISFSRMIYGVRLFSLILRSAGSPRTGRLRPLGEAR